MRVRGRPKRPAREMARCSAGAVPVAPSATMRHRSHWDTAAATASVHVAEVSTITTSASARSTSSKTSTGFPSSSARSGTPIGPQTVNPGATRIDARTISASESEPDEAAWTIPSRSRGSSTPSIP